MNESAPTSPPWHCVLCCCGYSLSYSLPCLALPCLAAYMLRCGPESKGSTVYGKPLSHNGNVATVGLAHTHTPTDLALFVAAPSDDDSAIDDRLHRSFALQPSSSERRQGHRCVLYAMRCWRGRPERVLQCDAVRDVCRTIVWECPHEINEACAWPMAATRSGFGRNARSPWPAEYSPSTHHGLQSTHQVLVDSDMKSHDRFDCRPDRRQSTAV
jgi:hypothetical protein